MASIIVNQARLQETFLTLVHFNTPSKQEKAASEWAGAYLTKLGFTVEWDDAGEKLGGTIGNLFAFKKGNVANAPGLLFSAHFDTVEATPGLVTEIRGDEIHATSDTILGADDKCGMAPILEAVAQISENNLPHGDIQLVLTICEEIGLVGARTLDPSRLKATYGYVLDSGPPMGTMTISAPSQNSIHVRIEGKPAHAGVAPEAGISAIVAASSAIAQMQLGRIDAETTANVGTIQGGTARNIVPAEVKIRAEARSRNHAKLEAQTQHMVEVFTREAASRGARAEIDVIEEYHGYELSPDSPVLALAMQAATNCGIPTTVLATGMRDIHTHDEWCTLSEMVQDTQWILEIIRLAASK
jgi:tripeptide aminopeptidase